MEFFQVYQEIKLNNTKMIKYFKTCKMSYLKKNTNVNIYLQYGVQDQQKT